MTSPEIPAVGGTDLGVVQAAIKELTSDPERHGLTWTLRPATVIQAEPNLQIRYDGDDSNIGATSMIGTLSSGLRVYVIFVPPSGNFICGWVGPVAGYYFNRQILGAAQSTVTFTNIPTNLVELEVGYRAACSVVAVSAQIRLRINGASGGNYFTEQTNGTGAATASSLIDNGNTSAFLGNIPGASSPNLFGSGKIWFQSWDRNGAFFPMWTFNNGTVPGGGVQVTGASTYNVLGLVSRLDFVPSTNSFITGSDFYIKGTFG